MKVKIIEEGLIKFPNGITWHEVPSVPEFSNRVSSTEDTVKDINEFGKMCEYEGAALGAAIVLGLGLATISAVAFFKKKNIFKKEN